MSVVVGMPALSMPTPAEGARHIEPLRPARHRYSLQTITSLVFAACVSVPVRTGARAYAIFAAEFAGSRSPSPSYSSVRIWLLRVGVHQLTAPLRQAQDWIYIIDHCVQLGCAKLFVVLGIRLSDLPEDFRLERSQMTVVHLEVMDESNQHRVKTALDKAMIRTGVPCQIVSDGGSDIKAGVASFQEENPHVIWSYDIHHKVAIELKTLAEGSHGWPELCAALAQFKGQVQQTPLAALAPPAQRGKARYMNIDVLVTYMRERLIPVYRHPEAYASTLGIPTEELKEKIDWVSDHLTTINLWQHLSTVGEFVRSTVNQFGYGELAVNILNTKLAPFAQTFPDHVAATLVQSLVAFVKEQSLAIPQTQRMLGSSEIIESVIGLLKNLMGNDAKNGFTSVTVALAALVPTLSPSDVMQALCSVSANEARAYAQTLVGPTVHQMKRQIGKITKSIKKNEKQVHDPVKTCGTHAVASELDPGASAHQMICQTMKIGEFTDNKKKEQNMGKLRLAA